MKFKVLGTKFNVSSYNNDRVTEAVLVEGKIQAGKNKLFAKTVDLIPGERIVFNKKEESTLVDNVDVSLYTSWIHGYLLLEKEPLDRIFRKMERYYNKKITVDTDLQSMTFSGKLDLNSEIEEVFENISFSTSLKVIYNNESFNFTR